jgi:hypothetical protein
MSGCSLLSLCTGDAAPAQKLVRPARNRIIRQGDCER